MNGVSPGSRVPSGTVASASNIASALGLDRRCGRLVDPVQPPLRRATDLAGQPAEQLAGDLAPRRDARELEEEDRTVRRGREPRDDVGGEQARAARLRSRRGRASGRRRSTSSSSPRSIAATSRAAPAVDRVVAVGRGFGRPAARTPRTRCRSRRSGPRAVARCSGCDEREQCRAGHELERGVEHERVGWVGSRGPRGRRRPRRRGGVGGGAGGGEGFMIVMPGTVRLQGSLKSSPELVLASDRR